MDPIDPARCRWVWRDDEWRLMQGPDRLLAALRRDVAGWVAYDADGKWLLPVIGGYTYAPDAREHVEAFLGVGHVMVSEHTTG